MSTDIGLEPGSDEARENGCTCRYVGLGGNDPDGHIRVDKWCPLHGIDPDAARDAMNDSHEGHSDET